MSTSPEPLRELLGPLAFATRDGAPIERISGLPDLVRAKVSAWVDTLSPDSGDRVRARGLLARLERYEGLSPEERRARLRGVLEDLRSLGRPPEPDPKPSGERRLSLDAGVRYLPGVGERRAELLARLGITSVGDLLLHLPLRYEDRSEIRPIHRLVPGQPATVRGQVVQAELKTTARRRIKIFEAAIVDDASLGGMVVARWFNQPHRARQVLSEREYLFSGKVTYDRNGTGLVLENPDFEPWEEGEETLHTGRVIAVYPATEGITPRQVRGWVAQALEAVEVPDPLPPSVREELGLLSRRTAFAAVHRPASLEEADAGHHRLAFEEFFFLQLGLALRKRQHTRRHTRVRLGPQAGTLERAFLAALPFALTGAQKRVLDEICHDLAGGVPMHRLVQGDVGCGKTVVALLALLRAVDAGFQGTIMAPTEVLAGQHHRKIHSLLGDLPVPVGLLVGGRQGKNQVLRDIADGTTRIVIGTQALIQDKVTFHRLGLAVIDEQHRFGVRQRAQIGAKGDAPHTLIMTATPIPRTLAMTVYGDLDLSVIDALPPGRRPVKTRLFGENRREQVYAAVRREVEAGRRAYVVHPLVEESEKLDLRAATVAMEELRVGPLHGLALGLLHGRMSGEEKAAVMEAFARGRIQVLVTTTVVEVGVDVAEATVMVVEHAERFGLSQLHQLRGRVGRGRFPGLCLLVTSPAVSREGKARLKALVESADGFRIAERDLEIRGPGELFGRRQSGVPGLKVANLIRDGALLEAARRSAEAVLASDPDLTRAEHRPMRDTVAALWRHHLKWGAVG